MQLMGLHLLFCERAHIVNFLCKFIVLSNCVLLSSCDLLRYGEGSLGLRSYADEETGECTAFTTLEDQSLKIAQSASYLALAAGVVFLALSTVHSFLKRIPAIDILLGVCAMFLELCLLEVYTAQDNGICEIEGCSWGTAAIWLATAQLAFIAASVGSFQSSKNDIKKHPWNSRLFHNSYDETLCRSQKRINLGLEYAS
jgi:hypothetical protein